MVGQSNSNMSKTTVFYDGTCPLCSAEIGYYKKLDTSQSLSLVDISTAEFGQQDILQYETAMARFHALSSDGRLLSGAEAFIEVWRGLPGWNWVAKLASIPGVKSLLEILYRGFLFFRPLIVKVYTVAHGRWKSWT